jgi:hypothetical protein
MCPTLTTVRESGIRLFKGYEFVEDRISRYLAHCTETRIVTKQWRVDQMYEELEPLLTQLEVHLNPSPGFLAQMKRIPPYKFRLRCTGAQPWELSLPAQLLCSGQVTGRVRYRKV